jgi:hypothetical protein
MAGCLLAPSAVADLAVASMLNADVISSMSEAALDLLTQDQVIVATWSAWAWRRRSSRNRSPASVGALESPTPPGSPWQPPAADVVAEGPSIGYW